MQSSLRPVIVVGSINIDLVSRVPRIPQAGETILGLDFQIHPGGKGANQAVGVARLGYPVMMVGMTGRDTFGNELRNQLAKEGVDMTHIGEVDAPTGTASITVNDEGENSIIITPGANSYLTPDVLRGKAGIIRGAGIVLTQLEIPIETVQCLSEICAGSGTPLILDPAPARSLPDGLLSQLAWFTPNEVEARFYASEDLPDTTLAKLFYAGARGVILKRGALGAILAERPGESHVIPAHAVQVVDTTAAGDAFNAAFAVGWMRGYEAVESAKFATTAAGISVTRSGAQPSLATQKDIERFLSAHG